MILFKTLSVLLPVWLLLTAALGFAVAVKAENATVAQGNSTSAHIDFIIVIPETLSLNIGTANDPTAPMQKDRKFAQPTASHRPSTTTSVVATGILSARGTMTLTAEGSILPSGSNPSRRLLLPVTWTSGGDDSTNGIKINTSAVQRRQRFNKHIYTFQRTHPHSSGLSSTAITYTLSSP